MLLSLKIYSVSMWNTVDFVSDASVVSDPISEGSDVGEDGR